MIAVYCAPLVSATGSCAAGLLRGRHLPRLVNEARTRAGIDDQLTTWDPSLVIKFKLASTLGVLLLCAGLAFLLLDILSAAAAVPCSSIAAGPDCYPWGTEGPAPGRWSYESKSNYLLRAFAQLGLVAGGGVLIGRRAAREQTLSALERAVCFAAFGTAALLMFV